MEAEYTTNSENTKEVSIGGLKITNERDLITNDEIKFWEELPKKDNKVYFDTFWDGLVQKIPRINDLKEIVLGLLHISIENKIYYVYCLDYVRFMKTWGSLQKLYSKLSIFSEEPNCGFYYGTYMDSDTSKELLKNKDVHTWFLRESSQGVGQFSIDRKTTKPGEVKCFHNIKNYPDRVELQFSLHGELVTKQFPSLKELVAYLRIHELLANAYIDKSPFKNIVISNSYDNSEMGWNMSDSGV